MNIGTSFFMQSKEQIQIYLIMLLNGQSTYGQYLNASTYLLICLRKHKNAISHDGQCRHMIFYHVVNIILRLREAINCFSFFFSCRYSFQRALEIQW